MRLAAGFGRTFDRADIERGMRPCGLRQIFDDAGNPVVAFHQQDIARLDKTAQMLRIAWRKRLISRHLLLKVAGDHLADGIEHDAHVGSPKDLSGRFFYSLSCSKAVAI